MKNRIKTIGTLLVALGMLLLIAGCASNGETNSGDEEKATSSDKGIIEIEEIAWNVEEGITDGERYVLLDYTNNSKYTICGFEITFKEKTDITDEEKAAFYDDLKDDFEFSDEDLSELKESEISMHADTDRVVNPGESVKNINCYYYSGYYCVQDINHYNLVVPDIATIEYVADNRIYTAYYDYNSKKYSVDEESEVAYNWTQTELGNKIPKPDVQVVEIGREDNEYFSFDAYGLSLEQFNKYVEECKELGYTIDAGYFEGFYSADNSEGYNVCLCYEQDDYCMNTIISVTEMEKE